jgi:hypothetical protein
MASSKKKRPFERLFLIYCVLVILLGWYPWHFWLLIGGGWVWRLQCAKEVRNRHIANARSVDQIA